MSSCLVLTAGADVLTIASSRNVPHASCRYAPTKTRWVTRTPQAPQGTGWYEALHTKVGRNVERSARHAGADGGVWGTTSQRRSVRPKATTYREVWFG
ncbi:hypothetical protein L227DRAFT_570159 [Lentinus tigrinus ALCF2SS1-6]|uniref:Uncharacterized protein n=1 Tax=Lentinus tigrinus ALCF2SS1-6 TaxID=1328759 RepID=A0A5C2T0Q3_9APHY|nr:hypothetical protein L227DRAFT_570159 [Lentinus tigrinus ALCF2SS1-6]